MSLHKHLLSFISGLVALTLPLTMLAQPSAAAQSALIDSHVHLWKGEGSLQAYEEQLKETQLEVTGIGDRVAIPFQISVENGHTHTDADPISTIKGGIPIGVISAPTRYLHSAIEVLDLVDLDQCVNLLSEFILSIDESWDLRPGI